MNSGNSFEYGRKLAIRLVIAASVCCVISLLCPEGSYYQFGFVALTAAIFVGTIICVYQFCRCPHCGKHIMLGVLAVKDCPRCHRNLATGKKIKKRR